jgi:hypothetical protein
MPLSQALSVVTRRKAINTGRVTSDKAPPLTGKQFQPAYIRALVFQDLTLNDRTTKPVITDDAIASNHPVAGDEQRNRISGERAANGTLSIGPPDLLGYPCIRTNLAEWNFECLHQH